MSSSEAPLPAVENLIWQALSGPHAHLALRHGNAIRYGSEIPPFAAVRGSQVAALADLRALVPPGDAVALVAPLHALPDPQWQSVERIKLIQMVAERPVEAPREMPPLLSVADVDDMLALAAATEPGPFARRSIELGRFFGFRVQGELVAMAGERLHPPGFTEISAVCTRADQRGRGMARELVLAVARQIQARGEVPFLHVDATSDPNPGVVGLYERLGFRVARRGELTIIQRQQCPGA